MLLQDQYKMVRIPVSNLGQVIIICKKKMHVPSSLCLFIPWDTFVLPWSVIKLGYCQHLPSLRLQENWAHCTGSHGGRPCGFEPHLCVECRCPPVHPVGSWNQWSVSSPMGEKADMADDNICVVELLTSLWTSTKFE